MAHSPKAMGAAILRNLAAKTGHPLEYWLEVVRQSGLNEKREVMAFLKTEHALGHFQAQKIFETSQGKDDYAQSDRFSDQIFISASSKTSYEEFRDFLLSLGDDVTEHPCKTYLPYYAKRQFALITRKKGMMAVGVAIDEIVAQKYTFLEPAGSLGSARINYQFTYPEGILLNDQAKAILRLAYEQNS